MTITFDHIFAIKIGMLQPGPCFGGSVCIDVAWNNAIESHPGIRKLYG